MIAYHILSRQGQYLDFGGNCFDERQCAHAVPADLKALAYVVRLEAAQRNGGIFEAVLARLPRLVRSSAEDDRTNTGRHTFNYNQAHRAGH